MGKANLIQGNSRPSAAPWTLTLRPGEHADIADVMDVERMPGFEHCVGRSDEAEHREMLASPAYAYRLGVRPDGAIEAFAILGGLGDPHRNLYLKRVAVARPGHGAGTTFLRLVLDQAFRALGGHRVHLDCFADNVRAQAAYAKLGFTRDGLLRQAYRMADGTRKDLVLMALSKDEWEGRRRAPT